MKKRKIRTIFVFSIFLFFTASILVKVQAQEENYEKQKLTIPWGDGIDHVPAGLFTWKDDDGKTYSRPDIDGLVGAAENIKVDDDGHVYVLYQFNQNKKPRIGVKSFDLSGHEIGSWEAKKQYKGFRILSVSAGKVYLADDLDNKILEFDKKLNLLQEINIPKSFNPPWGLSGTFVGKGMVHGFYATDPKDIKRRYVFDQEEWEKNGNPDFLDAPRRKIRLEFGQVEASSGVVTIRVYQRKWVSGDTYGKLDNFLFSDDENEGLTEEEYNSSRLYDFTLPVGIDEEGNIYIQTRVHELNDLKNSFVRIIEFNPQGKILARLGTPSTDFFHSVVDKNGNVYVTGQTNDGIQVVIWKKVSK